MKSAEVMHHILSCPIAEKEMFLTALVHIIKSDRKDLVRVQSAMEGADAMGAALTEAVPSLGLVKKPGRQKDPNSATGLIEFLLRKNGSATKGELRKMLMDKRGWAKSQAEANLFNAAHTLKVIREGYGDTGVWSLPEVA